MEQRDNDHSPAANNKFWRTSNVLGVYAVAIQRSCLPGALSLVADSPFKHLVDLTPRKQFVLITIDVSEASHLLY